MAHSTELPKNYPQNGEMACTTACIAFIHNYLAHEDITPNIVDDAIGRSPDGWVNFYAAQTWLLEKGHKVDVYYPPFNAKFLLPYLKGVIPYNEYERAFGEAYGEEALAEEGEVMKEWMEAYNRPNYQNSAEALRKFSDQKRLSEHVDVAPSPALLKRELKLGSAVLTYMASANVGGMTHAVTVFPHPKTHRTMVYIPDEESAGGSELRLAEKADLENVDYDEEYLIVR